MLDDDCAYLRAWGIDGIAASGGGLRDVLERAIDEINARAWLAKASRVPRVRWPLRKHAHKAAARFRCSSIATSTKVSDHGRGGSRTLSEATTSRQVGDRKSVV